jgi:phosphotriesterase-related protein
VIDCQPGRCGRDGRVLARLAALTGVEIAPATGFHLARYYAEDTPYRDDPATLLLRWHDELTEGLEEDSALRARVVKSAWTGVGGERERAMIAAAAEAAHRAGAALVVHTERGGRAEELAALLADTDAQPSRTQISHLDKRWDVGLHRELARAGFVLGYDAFLRPRYRPEEATWRLLEELAADELWRQVTVGLDLVDSRLWSVGGGAGLPAIGRSIMPRLRERLGEEVARALCGGNAALLLDGRRVEA